MTNVLTGSAVMIHVTDSQREHGREKMEPVAREETTLGRNVSNSRVKCRGGLEFLCREDL